MDDIKKLDLINEAMLSYKNGELTSGATLITIYNIIKPPKVTKKDIEWAKQKLREREK